MSKGSGDSRRFESKQSLLFPTGLNLLESKTQKLIKDITSEHVRTFKEEINLEKGIKKGRRVIKSDKITLVPNTKKAAENAEKKMFQASTPRSFSIHGEKGVIGRIENLDANRVEHIRSDIIKDIKKEDRKRKKEAKRVKIETVKNTGQSTCIILRGLREKTFNKNYLKKRLDQFGEIVRISSVVGQARSVMVRYADYKSCKKAYKTLHKNFAEIFPRFPKGDVKLVKPDKKIVQPIQSYSAFSNLEVDQKALYPFLYKANA